MISIEEVKQTAAGFLQEPISDIYKIPQSGGDRVYYRITAGSNSYIATASENVKENNTFLYFTEHFFKVNAPVPKVYGVNEAANIYVQQDFGDESLLSILEKEGFSENVKSLYKKTLKALAQLQVKGDENLDYNNCITSKEFGKQAILSDFLYFKYYFLDTLKIPYDKEKLVEDLDALANYLNHTDFKFFLYRDFQGRNVMIKNGEPYFIDYQGGMKGALQYDVASLLWQAKANLTDEWKSELLQYYIDCVQEVLGQEVDRTRFVSQYNGYVLIRLLQVLGAYGFRGIFERKAHFLTSIPLALQNLKAFIDKNKMGISVPEFEKILGLVIADDVINRFEPVRATAETPLVVHVKSFSFLKTGYPKNESTNGGGFVFDCRGILNPGRIEEYKKQTGRDKPVQDYLVEKTKMEDFLASVYAAVDISVEDYIKRNFEVLEVNFGCTGGQHRSVFAADALARHLKNKFGVKVEVKHVEQNFEN
jgi:aminoglycoside/choline kinase family phosphotransferase